MTNEERVVELEKRRVAGMAWHRPVFGQPGWIHLSAACYEHSPLIGCSKDRMGDFYRKWLGVLRGTGLDLAAWCLLPNHYHALVRTEDETLVRKALGKLHGRTSHDWNIEEGRQGRKCFHGLLAKRIRSTGHHWATVNYIHHNPVKHGYVKRWQDWPYTSAQEVLNALGRSEVQKLWREFPVDQMGRGWDE